MRRMKGTSCKRDILGKGSRQWARKGSPMIGSPGLGWCRGCSDRERVGSLASEHRWVTIIIGSIADGVSHCRSILACMRIGAGTRSIPQSLCRELLTPDPISRSQDAHNDDAYLHSRSKWPLIWIYSVIMFPEKDLPGRVGLDCTAHSRFLRGCRKSYVICSSSPGSELIRARS